MACRHRRRSATCIGSPRDTVCARRENAGPAASGRGGPHRDQHADPRRPAALRDPDRATLRLRLPVGRPGPLPRGGRLRSAPGGPAPDPDARGRCGDHPVADHACRPDRPAARPAGRGRAHGPGRDHVRPLPGSLGPHPGGDHRGHQPQRQRGRPVPRGGTGRPVADGHRQATDARLRLVQPRRVVRDGLGVAGGGAARRGSPGGRRQPGRQLPGHHRGLRAGRRAAGGDVRHPVARDRGAAGRRRVGGPAPWPPPFARRRGAPVGALRPRRVRRRLRGPEHRELLVPHPVRTVRSRRWEPSSSGPTSWPGSPR